jgi:hypothetical protein
MTDWPKYLAFFNELAYIQAGRFVMTEEAQIISFTCDIPPLPSSRPVFVAGS